MATRKEAEKAAADAGVSADDIKNAPNIAALEAATATRSNTTTDGAGSVDGKGGQGNTDPHGRNTADAPANAGGDDMVAGGGSQTGPGTDQLRGASPTPATIEPPAPTAAELESNKGGKIERMTAVAWWCPNCGHSNERSLNACGKCGAKVSDDGKSVGKPQRV